MLVWSAKESVIAGCRSSAIGWLAMFSPGLTPVMSPQPPKRIEIPVSWVGYDETPIVYANQFLIQFQTEGSFVIGVGQATPPVLIGSPAQVEEQAQGVEFVPIRPLARVAITEDKMRELIAALSATMTNFEQMKATLDPRGED